MFIYRMLEIYGQYYIFHVKSDKSIDDQISI